MDPKRVVVTGLGVVSALGRGKDAFWSALLAGKDAFAPVSSFDTNEYRTHVGAEIPGGGREAFPYALDAARQALSDAGLPGKKFDPARAGIILGTTSGEAFKLGQIMEPAALGRQSKSAGFRRAHRYFPGNIPARLASELGFHGPNAMLTTACAAGNYALGAAFDKISLGQAELMLAGGVDVFAPVIFAGFNRLLALAPEHPAPFSKDRKGLIPGEGCAVLVLEEAEAARLRGAVVYAELLGYGLSSDAFHVTMPEASGVARAISACLERCGLKPEDVDYINAHGTGTPANDKTETAAVKRAFGERARQVPLSSIKSMLGHGMGAASAFEAAACCLTLQTGWLPPTIHFTPGDPDCDLDYVPNEARKTDPAIVLSNAFAFGGSNSVVAFAKPGAEVPPRPTRRPVRVVVTGIGLVEEEEPVALAETLLPDKDLSFIDVPMGYALCAVKRALAAAALNPSSRTESVGIILDSSGEMDSLYEFFKVLRTEGPVGVEPRLFPNVLANAAASRAAIVFGLKLLNKSLAGSYPGGESALVCAADYLRQHGGGALLAGGVARGACVFAVETLEEARARGARPLAELLSCRESFRPGALKRDPGCFCLAKAISRVDRGGRSVRYKGRGLWGGTISLELAPIRQ